MIPGFDLVLCRISAFGHTYVLSVSAFEAVVVTLPVGLVTSVGIRNFYIPGNPGSHGWPSALRFIAYPCFGLLTHLF
jgi:hypothetical protein